MPMHDDKPNLPDGQKVLWEEPNPLGNYYPNALHEGWVHHRHNQGSLFGLSLISVLKKDGSIVLVHRDKLVW